MTDLNDSCEVLKIISCETSKCIKMGVVMVGVAALDGCGYMVGTAVLDRRVGPCALATNID